MLVLDLNLLTDPNIVNRFLSENLRKSKNLYDLVGKVVPWVAISIYKNYIFKNKSD